MSAKGTTVFDYAAAGERLYALRVALDRSRSDVVRDSDGTLDETYLGRVETGVAVASTLRVRRALARGLGVRTDDLTDLLDGRLTVERVVERATATLAERLMLAGAEHDTVVDLVLYLRDELASVAAERDALRAIVEGRTTWPEDAPTDAELDYIECAGYRLVAAFDGSGEPVRWWVIRDGRLCAWPEVPRG